MVLDAGNPGFEFECADRMVKGESSGAADSQGTVESGADAR